MSWWSILLFVLVYVGDSEIKGQMPGPKDEKWIFCINSGQQKVHIKWNIAHSLSNVNLQCSFRSLCIITNSTTPTHLKKKSNGVDDFQQYTLQKLHDRQQKKHGMGNFHVTSHRYFYNMNIFYFNVEYFLHNRVDV